MMFVLDTDTYTHILLAHPRAAERMSQAVRSGEAVGITIITKFELLQGRMSAVLKADTHEKFLISQQRFLLTEAALYQCNVLLLDDLSLQQFDELINIRGLKKIGRTDLLIASIVRAHRATLVTRNQKHFRGIPRLNLANWVD